MKNLFALISFVVLNNLFVYSQGDPYFSLCNSCTWYAVCSNNTWTAELAKYPKKVAKALRSNASLFISDTDKIDYLWDIHPEAPININQILGCAGSPSVGKVWRCPVNNYDYEAQAKFLYDDYYLYILLKVNDNKVIKGSGGDKITVSVAPYDSVAPGFTVDCQKYSYWNELGARRIYYFLDGKIGQHDYINSTDVLQKPAGYYDCWIGKKDIPCGYEAIIFVGFTWAMASGAADTINGSTIPYSPIIGQNIAFDIKVTDRDSPLDSSFVEAQWNTNNNDVWATMLYTGKLQFSNDLFIDKSSSNNKSTACLSDPILSKKEKTFFIYPNPANEKVMIKLPANNTNNISLKIYNELGQLALFKPITDNPQTITLDISQFPDGIYIIQLITADQTIIHKQKLIISKNTNN